MSLSAKKQARQQILARRIERIEARLKELHQIEARYPWARVAVFLVGVGASIAAFLRPPSWLGWASLGLFLVVFSVVAYAHRRVFASIHRFEILYKLAVEQRARGVLDWAAIPVPPTFPEEKSHPFDFDLNITGPRSLHQLIDTAASCGGSGRLRGWLLALAPDLDDIARRHALLNALTPRYGFRARLGLAAALATQPRPGERWDGDNLLLWLDRRSASGSLRPYLLPLFLLAALDAVLFILFSINRLPAYPWMIGLALFWGIQGLKYRETGELFSEAYTLAKQLGQFRIVLAELESYPYPPGSPLAAVAQPFLQPERKPSRSLRRLSWIVTAASFRSNMFLGLLLNTILPWDIFFTYLLERYKVELRGTLPTWLDAWYELEALSSLANFAVLNPDAVFPELAGAEEPAFSAAALGHPLIPDPARVTNDFSIQKLGQVAIITGSNMSGKSTFLRTVGVNLVLANAGSVVCAVRMRTVPLRVYTCINLSDSLSDGISYFYAEVRRLKGLLEALRAENSFPLFFLIDEIFRGTNNRERQQGSLAYTQALAGQNGVGLISTHDLDLARLSDQIPGVSNFHFREDVSDGRMVFDFKIRPGSSPTTNALKIMALEGLPTEPRLS